MKVGVRELRDGLSRHLAAVRAGESIVVTDHGRPVARLISYEAPSGLERLLAEGIATAPTDDNVTELPELVDVGGPVSDLVAEQRR